jgi:hypothetical protein
MPDVETVRFLIAGSLAQLGRLGLIKDVAEHLERDCNLQAALSSKPVGDDANEPLTATSLAWLAIRNRMRAVLAKSGRLRGPVTGTNQVALILAGKDNRASQIAH